MFVFQNLISKKKLSVAVELAVLYKNKKAQIRYLTRVILSLNLIWNLPTTRQEKYFPVRAHPVEYLQIYKKK